MSRQTRGRAINTRRQPVSMFAPAIKTLTHLQPIWTQLPLLIIWEVVNGSSVSSNRWSKGLKVSSPISGCPQRIKLKTARAQGEDRSGAAISCQPAGKGKLLAINDVSNQRQFTSSFNFHQTSNGQPQDTKVHCLVKVV